MDIHSIQVLAQNIVSEHALVDAFRVHHGDQNKMEILTQKVRAVVFFIQQKPNYSFHTKGSRGLTWMHPSCDKNSRLINFKRPLSITKNAFTGFLPHASKIIAIGYSNNKDLSILACLA